MTALGIGTASGTFGELLQGALPDRAGGADFLVTLPITRGTTAVFLPTPGRPGVRVTPVGKTKSRRLAEDLLARHGLADLGGDLRIDSELPEGKGEASSSADMVASARAIADALGLRLPPAEIEDLLRVIEPTDGVMYPEVVAFDHRDVRLRARLGDLPPATIVGVDEGGQVDTVAFNRVPKPFSQFDRERYRVLLDTVTRAVAEGDLPTVGAVATESSLMNQRLRRKRCLGDMIAICERHDGLGVVTAHSGTTLGILLPADEPGAAARIRRVRHDCHDLTGSVLVEQVSTRARAGVPTHPARKAMS